MALNIFRPTFAGVLSACVVITITLSSAARADEKLPPVDLQAWVWTTTPLMLDDMPMINPADEGRHSTRSTSRPSELPPVTVVGEPGTFREEQVVGTYNQPLWTADRRFPGVRTYVMPEGDIEFEYWTRADVPRSGGTEIQHLFELEFGLPGRFQFDFYGIARSEGRDAETFFDQQIEMRYAFADYGKIWGNPALYLEYAHRDQLVDKAEAKILLTGEICPGLHWGQNFLFEAETGGEREFEYGWTGGISQTIVDERFSIGIEAQFSLFDVKDNRGTFRDETFLGPSIQYRPNKRIHLDIAPLIGITHETGAAKLFFVFGCEF